jgi:phosphoglycerate dehydrogenase-like enzyme
MLAAEQFAALKRGAFFVNVSRGRVAREDDLVQALRAGQVAGAALDAYTVEPLPADHPFWSLPQVIVSPHYSGEVVNQSALPGELLLRNLRSYLQGGLVGHRVDLQLGY